MQYEATTGPIIIILLLNIIYYIIIKMYRKIVTGPIVFHPFYAKLYPTHISIMSNGTSFALEKLLF